eukprot:6183230-Pleurochrysis_carterae.AAC.7
MLNASVAYVLWHAGLHRFSRLRQHARKLPNAGHMKYSRFNARSTIIITEQCALTQFVLGRTQDMYKRFASARAVDGTSVLLRAGKMASQRIL